MPGQDSCAPCACFPELIHCLAQEVRKLRQGCCTASGGRIPSPLGASVFFFWPSRGLVRIATPWRAICFPLSPETRHIYGMCRVLASTSAMPLPQPTQASHTPAHIMICPFLKSWSDLHRSSAPHILSPLGRSQGNSTHTVTLHAFCGSIPLSALWFQDSLEVY